MRPILVDTDSVPVYIVVHVPADMAPTLPYRNLFSTLRKVPGNNRARQTTAYDQSRQYSHSSINKYFPFEYPYKITDNPGKTSKQASSSSLIAMLRTKTRPANMAEKYHEGSRKRKARLLRFAKCFLASQNSPVLSINCAKEGSILSLSAKITWSLPPISVSGHSTPISGSSQRIPSSYSP